MPDPIRRLSSAFRVFVLAGLPFLPLGTALAGQKSDAPEKCLLWKAESKSATVYLLGSVHVADAAMYPLDPTIERAFSDSDKLVVEVNLLKIEPRRLGQLVFKKGMYAAGDTLEKNVSKETLKKLEAFLKRQGLPLAAVSRQRPWLVSMGLSMQEVRRLGYSEQLGIDKYFLDKATAEKKEILELETAEGQINVLADLSSGLQELLLLSTLEEFSEGETIMTEMLEAWKVGDAEALDQLVRKTAIDDPKLQPIVKKLFDDRNLEMLRKVERYLKTEGTYFVVTGAGHVVGKKGIVQLLRDKGFEVRQLAKSGAKPAPATVK